ncbi:uncharacterized protein LOC113291839 [Papaver somniferum]|uniref:uncharacterized protein LOC113291839 n=1 Tax=Papaver somniferum TaxID=3469 RepID=UPI000E6FAF83|nr:uncharacterized protein LOC113291839 [Papaver somniferum]
MTSLSSIKVSLFEGKNIEHWRLHMENIFIFQEVWDIVKDGYVEPAEGAVAEGAVQTLLNDNRKKNSKATYILHQGVHESLMDRVIYIKQAKAAWDGLVSYYTGSDKVKNVRLQTLKRTYELLQMDSTETISDFFSKILNLVNEVKANGDTVEDSAVVEKILRSLSEKFESKVTAIEECNTVSTMTLNELLGSLQAYEQRFLEKTVAAKQVEEALQSQVSWRNNQGKPNAANIAESQEEEEEETEEQKTENMLLACYTPEEQPQLKWYLDTGCSNHMCGRKDLFESLDESVRSTVKFGNSSTISSYGKRKNMNCSQEWF